MPKHWIIGNETNTGTINFLPTLTKGFFDKKGTQVSSFTEDARLRLTGFFPSLASVVSSDNSILEVISLDVLNYFEFTIEIMVKNTGTVNLKLYTLNSELETFNDFQVTVLPVTYPSNWIDWRTQTEFVWLGINPVGANFVGNLSTGLTSNQAQSTGVLNLSLAVSISLETISFFANGSHPIWLGLSFLDNPELESGLGIRQKSIMVAFENRAYSRVYLGGREDGYNTVDFFNKNGNWTSLFQHSRIVVDLLERLITIEIRGRSTLNYNWSDFENGEIISRYSLPVPDAFATDIKCYHSCYFGTANSSSYLVASRIKNR